MMGSDHKATQSLAIYPIRQGGEGGGTSRLLKAKYPLNRFRGADNINELSYKALAKLNNDQ